MKTFSVATAAAVILAASTSAQTSHVREVVTLATETYTKGVPVASKAPATNDPRVQGCFASSGELTFISTLEFNSADGCVNKVCRLKLNKAVGGTTQGNQCWCGDKYPPKSEVVKDDDCYSPCTGFDREACGGDTTFTIYNTGVKLYGVEFSEEKVNTTSSQTAAPTVATSIAATTSAVADPSSSVNVAGIAAGVVVGVVAIGALSGGMWFFFRRRRNQALEEEHRRTAAVNAFIHGNKPPSSSGVSITDSRMDPVMAHRRMSDGSIADNQDYSRRILRVTNA